LNNLKSVMHNVEQVSPDLFYISADDFNWLIKQAEKVEQLEKDIKFHEKITAKYIVLKETLDA
jgi:hypothetical protein